ncbi:hypothetical protein [uncultured Aquimarina sp.]|uniref:hypothetical protein n=1 Tax=uncultured Aquimarina sp. TaxID=575652 RepID=UPI0026288752|nr:hypothetical protein [uncultured Aquimarina sp.]
MLKNISNLGKTLSRVEQKQVNGGRKEDPTVPDSTIKCYCNGQFVAMVDDVDACLWICDMY